MSSTIDRKSFPPKAEAISVRPVNDRLTQVAGRIFVKAFTEGLDLTNRQLIYTVTPGKILYVTLLSVTAVNTAVRTGRLVIQDNLDVADRIPFIVPQQPIGGQAGSLQIILPCAENPVPFTENVTAIGIEGTILASITIIGYEE